MFWRTRAGQAAGAPKALPGEPVQARGQSARGGLRGKEAEMSGLKPNDWEGRYDVPCGVREPAAFG